VREGYDAGVASETNLAMLPFPALYARMRAGEGPAWAEFHGRYEPLLRHLARRWLDPHLRAQADSLDMAQSVLRMLLESDGRVAFEDEARFRGWLGAVMRHRVARLARRARGPGGARWVGLAEDPDDGAEEADPAALAEKAEAVHRLKSALDRLTHEERQVVVLREFDGLAFADVAARLGKPSADAARKAFDRACERLEGLLRSDAPGAGEDGA
jgi:RNA polymerase sigma-70 factor (ECF subfamily)